MTLPSTNNQKRWLRIDLHIHTPASEDYAEPGVAFIDILHEAERRDLEIIAFTDHNTVAGYERMQREVEFLEQLANTGRATPADHEQLDEYYRLLRKITVLPGFEFTSHYGAHVLAIFPPSTPISLIEATLLQLGVPADKLKVGSTSVPDTKHVTEAYEIMSKAGALVIAAHANGPAGVITETLRMGTSGQARIAATQSAFLNALEFVNFYTDHGTFTNPAFYNGKTDHYERPMFCLQGSDAHRVRRAPSGTDVAHKHGIGDRYFEALLPDSSFAALRALLQSSAFDHIRVPKRDQKQWEIDQLRFGQASERKVLRGANDQMELLVQDVAALGNMGGGTLIIGAVEQGNGVQGVARPEQLTAQLRAAVAQQIEPAPALSLELLRYEGRDVIRVEVTAAQLPPYVMRNGGVYVRRDTATVPATRGDIVQLARRALAEGGTSPLDNGQDLEFPRSGVEIVDAQRRNGEWLYEIRDLRTTPGVSRDRAQGLWQYAIARHEDLRDGRIDLYAQITWAGRLGLLRAYQQGGRAKFDLVHRDANGVIDHIFYGVSDWGLGEAWNVLLDNVRPGESESVPAAVLADEQDARFVGARDERPPQAERALYPRPPRVDVEQILTPPVPAVDATGFGERRWRWRGRGGLWRIDRTSQGEPRYHLAMKHNNGDGQQEYRDVTRDKLSDVWLRFIRVPRPRTGIEVVSDTVGDDGVRRIAFRDLRHGELSAPWRAEELKEGSVREYAARMHAADTQLNENMVRWWGNLGYMRPMRSQVDLVYRDEDGIDHIYYAARREELRDEWAQLLAQWPDEAQVRAEDGLSAPRTPAFQPQAHPRSIHERGEAVGNGRNSPAPSNAASGTLLWQPAEYVRPWSRSTSQTTPEQAASHSTLPSSLEREGVASRSGDSDGSFHEQAEELSPHIKGDA
ncbi:MAG: putative DNA binding domain-containing protein [Chloroflexota bacterium]|nr:putative DNA binding domain-containing protein [Chloroflexota bacterium]